MRGYLDSLDKRMAAAKTPGAAVYLEAAELLTRLPGAPDSAQPFRDELRVRPFWSWVERTFARHRGRAPAPAPA